MIFFVYYLFLISCKSYWPEAMTSFRFDSSTIPGRRSHNRRAIPHGCLRSHLHARIENRESKKEIYSCCILGEVKRGQNWSRAKLMLSWLRGECMCSLILLKAFFYIVENKNCQRISMMHFLSSITHMYIHKGKELDELFTQLYYPRALLFFCPSLRQYHIIQFLSIYKHCRFKFHGSIKILNKLGIFFLFAFRLALILIISTLCSSSVSWIKIKQLNYYLIE